jgi:hypothetical protein
MSKFVIFFTLIVAFSRDAAAAPRTFVSATGVDTDPCSRTLPCRSFGAAVAQTTPGGSVIALDSAGYGPLTISQSVSLIAPAGIYAGITATSGVAITISGTTATDVVVLRGLSIEGAGGSIGIAMINQSLRALHIQTCSIRDFPRNDAVYDLSGYGLFFSNPLNAGARLFIDDSIVSGCWGGFYQFSNPGVSSYAMIDHCRAERNVVGFWIIQSTATITNSVADGNSIRGFKAENVDAQVTLDHCVATNNGSGITNAGVAMRVSNTTITHNTTGVEGGNLLSRVGSGAFPTKTNTVRDNGTNGDFTGTFNAQ